MKYCKHDVEQTIQVFLQRKKDFEAHIGLVKLACQGKSLDMSLISKTKPQLSAIILDAAVMLTVMMNLTLIFLVQ